MKPIFLVLLVLFMATNADAAPQPACICPEASFEDTALEATLLFTGRVLDQSTEGDDTRILFYNVNALKGLVSPSPLISLKQDPDQPHCKAQFETEKDYNVIVYGTYETGYYTNYCAMKQAKTWSMADFSKKMIDFKTSLVQAFAQKNAHASPSSPATEIEQKRIEGNGHLWMHNSEQALRGYAYLASLTDQAVPDLLGQMEAALQLQMAKLALERADDVLEKAPENQQAWRGRYRALAQLGRFSELPDKADLVGLIYRRALWPVDMPHASLAEAEWLFVSAAGRDLSGATLTQARLSDVDLSHAKLVNADLSGALLHHVVLNGADLSGAKLENTQFSHITSNAKTIWPVGFDKKRLR